MNSLEAAIQAAKDKEERAGRTPTISKQYADALADLESREFHGNMPQQAATGVPERVTPENGTYTVYEKVLSEKQIQAAIVHELKQRGYTVMETGKPRHYITCPTCLGKFQPYGAEAHGNTPDCPDLFVIHPTWLCWRGLEVKTPKGLRQDGKPKSGDVSDGQQALADVGFTVIVRSVSDALRVVGEPIR